MRVCSFYVRLQGTLNNPAAKIATPRDYKVTRELKHVVMQCVTQIIGPFGDDGHYLLSSADFISQSPIFQVSYNQVGIDGLIAVFLSTFVIL